MLLGSVFILSGFSAYGQKEATIWHFGPTAKGFYFDPTLAPIVTNYSYTPYSGEGCSVLTDPVSGILKFYTDGSVVVDIANQAMPNGSGLISDASSFGKGKICNVPGNCNRYYIFHNNTSDSNPNANLYYSVVDMSLQGNGSMANPKGDVVSGLKNVLITTSVAEGLEVVPKENSHEFWLLVPKNSNSSISVYNVSSAGITFQTNYPLISSLTDIRGFRYSPASKKLCVLSMIENQPSLVADFNPITGVLSNQSVIPGTPMGTSTTVFQGMFDAEFSPDGNKLYITKYRVSSPVSGGKIYQYDFLLPANNPLLVYNAGSSSSMVAKGMRLGPDGKIYFMVNNSGGNTFVISAINNPNLAGGLCNVVASQISMGSNLGNAHCLPNFLPITNTLPIPSDTIFFHAAPSCMAVGDTISFDLVNKTGLVDLENDNLSYSIVPNGGNSFMIGNQINYVKPIGTIASDTLWISLCDDFCYSLCDTFKLVIQFDSGGSASLNLPAQYSACSGDTIGIDGGVVGLNYSWSTGDTTQIIDVTSGGTLTVVAADVNGCVFQDTIDVVFIPSPSANLGADIIACDPVVLNIPATGSTVVWNGSIIGNSITASTSGLYYVEVTDANGCSDIDSINVTISQVAFPDLGPDTSYCDNISFNQVLSVSGFSSVLWSDGSSQNTLNVNSPGTYFVTVQDVNGCSDSDTILISEFTAPVVDLGNDTSACNTYLLSVSGNGLTILWNGTQSGNSFIVTNSGDQFVQVTDQNGCTDADTINVLITGGPIVNLGADTSFCGNTAFVQTLSANGFNSVLWSDGSSGSTYTISTAGIFWVTVSDASGCMDSDSIVVTALTYPIVNLGQDFEGCPQTLNAAASNSQYLWSDGSTGATLDVDSSGTYSVVVTNGSGCVGTDTINLIITGNAGYFSFIPNVFSPNADGVNDVFKIEGLMNECSDQLHVEIYNRWGQLMFTSDDPAFEWKGRTLINTDATAGVYYVLFSGTFGNTDITRHHTVTLVR